MKILFINDLYHGGGAENCVREIIEELNERGHEPYLLTREKVEKEGVFCVFRSKYKLLRFLGFFFSVPYHRKLKEIIKEIKPEIIYVHNTDYITTISYATKNLAIPIIKTIHDYRIVCPSSWHVKPNGAVCENTFGYECVSSGCISLEWFLLHFLEKKFKKRCYKHIDLFISPSSELKKVCEKHRITPIKYLSNFIDTNKYHPDFSIKEENYILYVGELTTRKGLEYLLQAISKVIEYVPEAVLHIFGKGADEERLRRIVNELRINDNVSFHGFILRDQLIKIYQKATVLVLPSIGKESSPLVIYEAMACGTPVIGSNIGGIRELIRDGETGYIFHHGDVSDLSKNLLSIMKGVTYLKFGKSARLEVEKHYTKRDHCNELLNFFYYACRNT